MNTRQKHRYDRLKLYICKEQCTCSSWGQCLICVWLSEWDISSIRTEESECDQSKRLPGNWQATQIMLGKSFLSLVCKHSSNQACYPFLTWKLSIRWVCFINQALFNLPQFLPSFLPIFGFTRIYVKYSISKVASTTSSPVSSQWLLRSLWLTSSMLHWVAVASIS